MGPAFSWTPATAGLDFYNRGRDCLIRVALGKKAGPGPDLLDGIHAHPHSDLRVGPVVLTSFIGAAWRISWGDRTYVCASLTCLLGKGVTSDFFERRGFGRTATTNSPHFLVTTRLVLLIKRRANGDSHKVSDAAPLHAARNDVVMSDIRVGARVRGGPLGARS